MPTIENNAAVNMGMIITFLDLDFRYSRHLPRSEIVEPHNSSVLEASLHCSVFCTNCIICIPNKSAECYKFYDTVTNASKWLLTK